MKTDKVLNENSNIQIFVPEEATLSLPDPSILAYYQDAQNRIFWFGFTEISDSDYDIVQAIIRINREDYGVEPEKRKPIRLLFNSPGGSLDVADALCSVISISKTPVYGYAIGMVASAASLIFLACHKRFAIKTAYWVLHQGSANMSGSYSDVMSAMLDYQTQIEHMIDYYLQKTTYPQEVLEKNIQTDWYIHVDEALQYGIIQQVVEDIDLLYSEA